MAPRKKPARGGKKKPTKARKPKARSKAPAKPKPSRNTKMGRPTKYTPELGELICSLMCDGDKPKGLSEVARDSRVNISDSAIYRWVIKYDDFREKYAHARKVQADRLAWSAKEVAAHALELSLDDKLVIAKLDIAGPYMHAKMAQARLMVDTLKWMAGKLHPAKYGKTAEDIEQASTDEVIDLADAEKRMTKMSEQDASKLYAEAVKA